MALDSSQKKYIAQNTHRLSPVDMAAYLNIPEKEITDYLRKKWTPEKYQKYLNRFVPKTALSEFNFKNFFAENKLILTILTFLVFVSYANSLNNGFVSDDLPAIVNNPGIADFSTFVLSSPLGFIQNISYYLAFNLDGLNPIYFRIPNILFHLGATFSAFLVLYLTAPRTLAFMSAALFAVHPILVESVTWISGGPYSQQGFFFLLFFALYILSKQKPKLFYISLFVFMLSVSPLPRGAISLVAIFVYEWFFGNLKQSWKKMLPFLTVCLVTAIVLFGQLGHRITALNDNYYLKPGTDNLLVKIPTSVFAYFHLLLWPDNLSLYQTEMVFTIWEYRFSALIFLIYVGAIVYFYKKNRLLSFWLIFFIIPLIPTLSPLRIAWAVAERYAYLSSLGIIVVIAYLFYRLSQHKKMEMMAFMLFWSIVFGFSVRTIIRNNDWENEEALWIATVKTSPSGSPIHNNMGNVYFQKGEYEKSIAEFQLAAQINPGYADAYHNLGNVYYQLKKIPEATENFQKALAINPRLWQSHQNLAAIYFSQQSYDMAYAEIKKALEINPANENLKKNLELIEKAYFLKSND